MRQRAEIMKRIGTLKQTISGLANLFGDDILGELAGVGRPQDWRAPARLYESMSHGFDGSGTPLGGARSLRADSATFARDLLRHKDPLASVTTVLNRLVEYGEALSVVREWPASMAVGIGSLPAEQRQ